jgi:CheY-like chemotaxis protein
VSDRRSSLETGSPQGTLRVVRNTRLAEKRLPARDYAWDASGPAAPRAPGHGTSIANGTMMFPPDDAALPGRPRWSALVVAPVAEDMRLILSTFTGRNLHLSWAESFGEAKVLLGTRRLDVLITDLYLAEYNGLHLVLRGKATHPQLAAVVLSRVDDPVLRADAERMRATFVLKPFTPPELAAAVMRTLHLDQDEMVPLRPRFERRVGERRTSAGSSDPHNRRIVERRIHVLGGPALIAP